MAFFALDCQALLFDLDGTLIDSLPAVDRAWTVFSEKHGLDPAYVLTQIHGKRSIDSIRRLLPEIGAEEEDAYIRYLEATDTTGVTALTGALELLQSIPTERWAVVTSGTSDVAMARLKACGLPKAGAYVFGEDVHRGKPAPDPFLLAARKLGFAPKECVGVEDTLAGVQSIEAAGMPAIGIGVESQYIVRGVKDIRVEPSFDGLSVIFGFNDDTEHWRVATS